MRLSERGHTSDATYFVTSSTFDKRHLFQSPRYSELLLDVIQEKRRTGKLQVHEYVIMPDHIHLLVTPASDVTLERVVQLIKGSYSFLIKRELGFAGEVWQTSFYDRRIRDLPEYQRFRMYIHMNPVRRGIVGRPEEYRFSSGSGLLRFDPVPQRLKPRESCRFDAGLKACSTQNPVPQ
jgi:putative transposase